MISISFRLSPHPPIPCASPAIFSRGGPDTGAPRRNIAARGDRMYDILLRLGSAETPSGGSADPSRGGQLNPHVGGQLPLHVEVS